MGGHVFISYSRRDSGYVKELVEHLRAAGLPVWIDDSLQPGTPTWVRTVERAIEQCFAFVPVMSLASTESAWVDREIDLAQELGKPILPLLLEGRRFLRLRDIQTEDVTGGRLPGRTFVDSLEAAATPGLARGTSPAAPGFGGSSASAPGSGGVRLLRTLSGHTKSVQALAFSPDGTELASGSADCAVLLWNPDNATVQRRFTAHAKQVTGVAWSPDGTRLASCGWDNLVAIHERPWQRSTSHKGVDTATSVTWSPDSRYVACGSWNGTVMVFDDNSLVSTFPGDGSFVNAVAWSPDGRYLACGTMNKVAHIWDPGSGTVRCTLGGHTDGLAAVAWSPDSRLLATAGFDTTVRIWDPALVTNRHTLTSHGSNVSGLAWSPDGRLLASSSGDHTVRLWAAESGTCLDTITVSTTQQSGLRRFWSGDRDSVGSVAWSPDGRRLATGSLDGTIRLWLISPGTE